MLSSINELEKNIIPAIPMLKQYWDLLLKWQKKVNLVSPKTLIDGWNRHVLDSAQIYFLIENQIDMLMDVGSGGGFPGVVIAILNKVLRGPIHQIVLVEVDLKKSLFLEECNRALNLDLKVIRDRVEKLNLKPNIITARAFAPLNELLSLVRSNVSRETILLLPKGKNVEEEMKKVTYHYEVERIKNIVNSDGCILKIKGG